MRQRLKQGSKGGLFGHQTTMADVEPYLVDLIKKLAAMRTPITTSQGLELATLLIEGKSIQKEVLKWKAKNCHAYKLHGSVKLVNHYRQKFQQRNSI